MGVTTAVCKSKGVLGFNAGNFSVTLRGWLHMRRIDGGRANYI